MSRRTIAIAAALSVLALGSPLMTGCTNTFATNSFNSGVDKYEQGDYQGAIADYNKALEIKPKNAIAYYNRGVVMGKLKEFKGAIADYTNAIEINPQYAGAYLNRGITRELVNDLQGACDDWRKAVDLGKERPAVWVKKQC